MIESIYYAIQKVPKEFSFNKALPNNILEYINNKHGAKIKESLFAWGLLNQLINADLSKVTFLKSNKPILNGLSFSISHSKGYVAIAFCYQPINLGIDIQKIEDKDLNFLGKLSKEFKAQDRNGQYHLWTKREATVKALNLKLLSNDLPKFKGVNNSVLTADGEFSVSIYNDSELNLKEISYEDYI